MAAQADGHAGTTIPDFTKKPGADQVSDFGDRDGAWLGNCLKRMGKTINMKAPAGGGIAVGREQAQIIMTCTTSIRAPKPSTKPTMGSTNLTHWLNWMPSICRVTSTSPVGARNSMAYCPQL